MTVGLLSFGANRSVFNGGLSQMHAAGTEQMFLNIMKTAQNWSTITGGNYVNPDASTGFNFDANGYARNIPVGTDGLKVLVQIPTSAERSWSDVVTNTTGAYTFTWDGGGVIYMSGLTVVSGSLTSSAASTGNTVTLRPTSNRPLIGVSSVTSSTDYPRNFNLYYTTDQADVTAGKVLSAKARERLLAMRIGAIRFLSWMGGDGNESHLRNWSDRKPVGFISYAMTEPRTAVFAGRVTTDSTDHYSLTFDHPDYGTAAAVDGQLILAQWDEDQVGTYSYLTYNGREDIILNKYGEPASSTSSAANSGIPATNMYTTLRYDALLEGWISFSTGNATDTSVYLDNGVPPEIQLAVAVELGAHPHFQTPGYAADSGTGAGQLTDYMSNFIDMVRSTAPSWVIPTWENVNEWWNSAAAFYIYNWGSKRQKVRNGGERPGETAAAPFQVTSITYGLPLTVTGTGAGASSKVRLTVASTATLTTGEIRTISSVGGTIEANGVWPLTVIDATHVDLDGSTYANAWTSGGSVSGQTVMQVSGSLPPLGASLTALNQQPSGLNGANNIAGNVTAVSGSSIKFDAAPTGGSWAGNSSAATLTLVGSTVSVTYTTANSNAIVLSTTGTLPAPLVAGTVYYVKTGGAGGTPFQIALTAGGAAIDFSAGSQSGTHTAVQVIALQPNANDHHNAFGTAASNLGQLLQSKYGVADPKTQTQYRFALGVQNSAGDQASGTTASNPRATSKFLVINTADPADMAKHYATHVTPSNYFNPAAYNDSTKQTALSNRWDGTQFTAGIVNGIMTIASFQSTGGSTTALSGHKVFGFGLPALSASSPTIVSGPASGTGAYTLSDLTINVASGTTFYSGSDFTAVQDYVDANAGVEVTVDSISNGSGAAGNQMVVSAISSRAVGRDNIIYLGSYLVGSPINLRTSVSSQSSGSSGSTGTYIIDRSSFLVSSPTTFKINGSFTIDQIAINLQNWKAWAQGFGINKMLFYEGGYSPDYTGSGLSKVDLLRYASKWVATTPVVWPTGGIGEATLASFASCDALTDGTFTAEFPSHFLLEGRYPSTNTWAVWETLDFTNTPPIAQAIADYNN